MTYFDVSVAGTVNTGTDLAGSQWFKVIDKDRVCRRIGVAGGTNIGDTVIEVAFGSKKIAEIRSRIAGSANSVPVADTDMKSYWGNEVLKAGQPLNLNVKAQTGANAIVFSGDFPEVD